ncbi:MAG: inverse autotransporter beta domain-containing protein [Polaromonas sp.]|uniref:inverse autotransporter beta domain-containing protein n=1 Tax=Polaromonas sp. TaxID=1869339 RepID=UPI002489B87E|nr:inverse autotransporter beta domain-containing protein [Polaromonas sp.]MDI1270860.1 inverse autotransporter beta domain-containing protein [Polaromonas sp.]
MKNSSIAVLAGGLFGLFSAQAAGPADAPTTAAGQNVVQQAKEDSRLPDWLRRTDISVESMDRSNPTWSVETVQPLYQTPRTLRDTVFFQGRWARRNSDNTFNLGLGYRNLLEDKTWLLGLNTFYDTTTRYDHKRWGLGAEAIGQYLTFRTNFYHAISGERTISLVNGISTTEKALSGHDFEIDAPLPYLSWMRVAANAYRWRSATSGVEDIKGARLALIGNISRNVSLELGRQDDNYTRPASYIKISYNLLGNPGNGVPGTMLEGMRKPVSFEARDLTLHTLDKVRRQNDIVVERKTSGSSGVTIGRRN